ncbi:MAG: glycosyltransferase [Actinobacteria bacterium]|nr:glycosyltransferase [Actinomycetota bacterium]
MRLAAYTDYAYHRVDDRIYAERAFALFLDRLGERLEKVTILGRLAPGGSDSARYPLGEAVGFVPFPYYTKLTDPRGFLRGASGTLRAFWRGIDEVDCVAIFGPHPFAVPFILMAWARRKKVVLGVRQDTPAYVRSRHPGRRSLHRIADLMDAAFRFFGRFCSVIAVGPAVAESYRHSRRLLEISVSLVDEDDVVDPAARQVSYEGDELVALSVGRLEVEKNPLLLADTLRLLVERDPRWRLVVCGEGGLEAALRERLEELGVADRADLRGYVPHAGGLAEAYRESHVLLHVSWTEGLPQILYEAFAAALPVVATDVGGIRAAVGSAVSLIPAGDAPAAADAVARLGADPKLRTERIGAGNALVRASTFQVEVDRVANFIEGR